MTKRHHGINPAALGAGLTGDFANVLVAMTPGGIERQEANGQRDFVASETLPAKIGQYDRVPGTSKAILEVAGVRFLGPVDGDPIFQRVQLPAGWKKEPTDHSMWSKLVDEKGRERAAIFYKAAFYDRHAHMSLTRRYGYQIDYDRVDAKAEAVARVTDCGAVIHETDPLSLPSNRDRAYYDLMHEAEAKAAEWLEANYPDWEDAGAYWA